MRENDAISRSAVLEVGNVRQVTEYDEAGYSMTYNAVPVDVIEALPSLDVAQIVTNGKDTTYLRVKKLDGLRGRIVIDEESGNRCAMYYEEAEDLAPVVYCKDCIHARPLNLRELMVFDSGCFVCTSQYGACSSYPEYEMTGKVVFPKGFCSYAHRRTNGR